VHVESCLDRGQQRLGAGQLEPGHHLLGRAEAPVLDVDRAPGRRLGQLPRPRLDGVERRRQLSVALAGRLRADPDGQPEGYER
jgi:hypothetical protein